ncbi:O-antigen ligase family protein [Arthrobacter sp. StoSoilB5]|uniref:O-antigen ligase family protein n=1 Tax=Arthrobacter sp. StoSoilB5 TaxID=2830992 RepID=UPI001CC3DCD6|nr:O-antigen ligase family protein [Arthrobacter sp. StoSoilB5]
MGQTAQQPERSEVATFVTIYLVVTCAVPSNLTISALGTVGRLTTLWALLALIWWVLYQVHRTKPEAVGRRPVRLALALFLAVAVASYAVAMLHGLPDKESSPADGGLIRLLAWAGILLLIHDGLKNRDGLVTVMRSVVLMGTFTAILGLLQFVTGASLIDWITIPGMSSSADFSNIDVRGGFVRAAAMASHPLEYGVVLSSSFPIALTLALTETTRNWLLRWLPVIAIAVASVLSVSRSALIAVAIAFVVLIPAWSRSLRRRAYVASIGLVAAVYVVTPGLLGTLRGLFTVGGDDSSITSRTNGYSTALGMLENNPIVGRAFGTFLPEYIIVDNQYLGLLVELGVLGLAMFLALIASGLSCAWRARRLAVDNEMRQMSQSVLASLAAIAATFAFFDGLSFPMAAAMLFVMLGVAGALWRIVQDERGGLLTERLRALPGGKTAVFGLLRPRRDGVDDGSNR